MNENKTICPECGGINGAHLMRCKTAGEEIKKFRMQDKRAEEGPPTDPILKMKELQTALNQILIDKHKYKVQIAKLKLEYEQLALKEEEFEQMFEKIQLEEVGCKDCITAYDANGNSEMIYCEKHRPKE